MKQYYVYIMASKRNGTLYIGYAITREKQLKAWKRQWKLELIECVNPEWRDLSEDLL